MSVVGGAAAGVRDRRRLAAIVVSALLVLVAIALAAQGSGGEAETQAVDTSPHLVGAGDLTALEDSLGHAVYWAGERAQDQLELTEEAGGSIYLRYLPPAVEAGDPRPGFLTVGTYPVEDAVGALRRTAAKAGVTLEQAGDGGVVLANPASGGSVYLAYPGSDLQIEVYDPRPGRALGLIRSGVIGPVG
jgi:hypothetical protein